MPGLMSDADMSHLQSMYPYLNIQPLTSQQERFLLAILRGASVDSAEQAVGYTRGGGRRVLANESVAKILEYFRQHTFKDIRVTRDSLTNMLLEAHAKAANATEEVIAIREMGKMHGLYESDNQRATKVINQSLTINNTPQNAKQMERLSTAELLKLAELPDVVSLPTPIQAEEAEFIEVPRGTD